MCQFESSHGYPGAIAYLLYGKNGLGWIMNRIL
jgi:hypothetical protein